MYLIKDIPRVKTTLLRSNDFLAYGSNHIHY